MGKHHTGWYVNAPGAGSPRYRSLASAARAAWQVRGARVRRQPSHGGRHTTSRGRASAGPLSNGCAVLVLAAVVALIVGVSLAGYALLGV